METFIPWTRVNRGVRREIITPLDTPQAFTVDAATERTMRKAAQSAPLIRALGLAHYWQRLLDEGRAQTIADTAALEKMDVTQARRLWSHCSPIPMWRQSGERAAPGDATGLAGAGGGGVVGGAEVKVKKFPACADCGGRGAGQLHQNPL